MSSLTLGIVVILFENKCEKLYGKRIDVSAVPGEIATLKEHLAIQPENRFRPQIVMETHNRS
jgi:hypothetical protein